MFAFFGCRFHADKPCLRFARLLSLCTYRPRRRLASLPMRPYWSPSNGGVSGCGLDPPGLLKWRTCARLCWARARQARPPRLRLFSFPVRPPGRGGRPRASDESARGGAMSKGEQPRALRQSLQKSFATRWPPGRGTFLLEISVMSGVWTDTRQVSVGRERPNRRNITVRRRDDADDAVRSGPEHAGAFDEMVLAQGLGDEDRQTSRDEEGDRGAGASAGRDHASHLG